MTKRLVCFSALILGLLLPSLTFAAPPCSCPVVMQKITIDASAGGVGVSQTVATLPAQSFLLGVATHTTQAFNGDPTTSELRIGPSYDTSLYSVSDLSQVGAETATDLMAHLAVETDIFYPAGVSIVATWTNSGGTAGKVDLYLVYARVP